MYLHGYLQRLENKFFAKYVIFKQSKMESYMQMQQTGASDCTIYNLKEEEVVMRYTV